MAIKIVWSDEAEKTFNDNLEYLFREWSDREVLFFLKQTRNVFSRLQEYPESYPPSPKSNKVRRARVNKYITLYYRYYTSKKEIALLSWWNTKQDPSLLKY
jgi:plasmid stabilization system protein ParE